MKVRQVFRTYDPGDTLQEAKSAYCRQCGATCSRQLDGLTIRDVCSKCGKIHYQNPAPAVSVLVNGESNVLLCKRAAGYFRGGKWCLPCGFIEFGEDYLTAAIREVKEETGLEVQIQSIISVVTNFFNPDLHTLVVVLSARAVGGELKVGDAENDEVRWFPASKKLPEMAFEADTHIIHRFFETNLAGAPVDEDYWMNSVSRG